MPDTPLASVLQSFRGQSAHLATYPGNNGDDLITRGAAWLLQKHALPLAPSPDAAQVLLIRGGAGATDAWGYAFDVIRDLSVRYPDKPLVLLPSTIQTSPGRFAACFAGRSAPAHVLARESFSYDFASRVGYPSEVHVGLDHDTAFALADSPYLDGLKAKAADRHLLIVERGDREAAGGERSGTPLAPGLARFLPDAIKLFIRRRILHRDIKRTADTPFSRAALDLLHRHHPAFRHLPILNADISHERICGQRDFALAVARAAAVVTTRLHVGILAYLLEKPLYLALDSPKIRGIWQHSMSPEKAHLVGDLITA